MVTAATIVIVLALAAFMAYRGYRRGAVSILLGWLPVLMIVAALYAAVWFWVKDPDSTMVAAMLAVAGAILLFMVGRSIYRLVRRFLPRDEPAAAGDEAAGTEAEREPTPAARWPAVVNGIAGGAMGLFFCLVLCLVFSALLSTIVFGMNMDRQKKINDGEDPGPPSRWVPALSEASDALAEISDKGGLGHIPSVKEYTHEIRATITVLNAPRDVLVKLAERRDLDRFRDIPEVQDALNDYECRELIKQLGTGDMRALDTLRRNPKMKRMLECPAVKELTDSLKPSDLAREIEEIKKEA